MIFGAFSLAEIMGALILLYLRAVSLYLCGVKDIDTGICNLKICAKSKVSCVASVCCRSI